MQSEKRVQFARGHWRQWLGSIALAVIAIAAGSLSAVQGAPAWAWIALAAVFVIAALLAAPARVPSPAAAPSAFIRGDLVDSELRRINSSADVFIDGDVRTTRIFDVIFRGRKA